MDQTNATRTFLGDETQWNRARIDLSAIQGLWGGLSIHIADKVVVRRVQPGQFEKRYEFALDAERWKSLLHTLIENDFLTITPPDRMGIPDEVRPSITLTNAAGEKFTVAKWAGVKDERFDRVYAAISDLEALTKDLQPAYSGPFQYDA